MKTADTCDRLDERMPFDLEKVFGKITNGEKIIFNGDETFDLRMVKKYV